MDRSDTRRQRWWIVLPGLALMLGISELVCWATGWSAMSSSLFKRHSMLVDDAWREPHVRLHPVLMWAPRAGYRSEEARINSHGLQDKEYSVTRPPGVFRILALGGDANTSEGSVPQSMTWDSLLERDLNRMPLGGNKRYEVINGGCSGYTSAQGVRLYETTGASLRPDLVIFYFGHNESQREHYLSDKQVLSMAGQTGVASPISRLLCGLHTFRALRGVFLAARWGAGGGSRHKVHRVSLAGFRADILSLKRQCGRYGARLLLLSPPLCREKIDGTRKVKAILRYRAVLEATAIRHGIPYLKIKELTRRPGEPTAPYFLDLAHPSLAGHRVLTDRLLEFLKRRRLLSGPQGVGGSPSRAGGLRVPLRSPGDQAASQPGDPRPSSRPARAGSLR